jgi:hypothetical protein
MLLHLLIGAQSLLDEDSDETEENDMTQNKKKCYSDHRTRFGVQCKWWQALNIQASGYLKSLYSCFVML